MRRQITGHPVNRRVLFLEKRLHVGRNLVFVAEHHIVVLVDRLLCLVVDQFHFGMHDDEHRCNLTGGGFKEHGVGLNRKDFAVQDGIGGFWVLYYPVFRARNELANHGFGHSLLDAVSRRIVLERWYRDVSPVGRQLRCVSCHVIAAAGGCQCSNEQGEPERTGASGPVHTICLLSQRVPPRCARRWSPRHSNCRQRPTTTRRRRRLDRARSAPCGSLLRPLRWRCSAARRPAGRSLLQDSQTPREVARVPPVTGSRRTPRKHTRKTPALAPPESPAPARVRRDTPPHRARWKRVCPPGASWPPSRSSPEG